MEKSYEELIGIHQGYMKMVTVLTGSQDNVTNQDIRRRISKQGRLTTKNFKA